MSGHEPASIKRGERLDAPDSVLASIGAVVDYRGDVTIACRTGESVQGYVFDCVARDDPHAAMVRLLPSDGGRAVSIPLENITALEVTGRDTAEGKSFETWVRKYVARMRADGRI